MPIRLNLLAEQQAAEESRRRDPVKRAAWAAATVVALLVLYAVILQLELLKASFDANRFEARYRNLEKDSGAVITNLNRTAEAQRRMESLGRLSTNRFLWANVLNALQYSVVDDIAFVRLRGDQSFAHTDGIKPSTNAAGVVSRGKPPTSREKVTLAIDAKDYSGKPGDQIFKFKEAIDSLPFFKTNLQKSELTGRSPVTTDPNNPNRPYVQFTLECLYHEKTR